MWSCTKCREKLEDDFDVCWNCGTTKDGVEDPDFRKADDAPTEEVEPELDISITAKKKRVSKLQCLRCKSVLGFMGEKKFHEGTRWGAWGDFAELFVNKEVFDVYACVRCGHVELFVKGIGENLRPREGDQST